mmetsp:Transcript_236/g.725  ORF Transcript_236/g.725 Transcript_236/m.725 type:complete len:289 (+) Transcript_236:1093-1959(+)
MGHPCAGRREARDVRLVRRADKLPVWDRVRQRRQGRLLAVRRPPHRQRHHLVPLHHLARAASLAGHPAASLRPRARVRPRQRRAQDEQVARQCGRPSRRAHAPLRRRVPLLPRAGRALRGRPHLLRGCARAAAERGARGQLWQLGAASDGAVQEGLRRRGARSGGRCRGRPVGAARGGGGGDAALRHRPGALLGAARARRGQQVRDRRGPLEAPCRRPEAAGGRANPARGDLRVHALPRPRARRRRPEGVGEARDAPRPDLAPPPDAVQPGPRNAGRGERVQGRRAVR